MSEQRLVIERDTAVKNTSVSKKSSMTIHRLVTILSYSLKDGRHNLRQEYHPR